MPWGAPYRDGMRPWWEEPLCEVFADRRVIVAGAVASAWGPHVDTLRAAGADDVMVVATDGRGVGPLPDVTTVVLDPPEGLSVMEVIHHGNAVLGDPPPSVVDAVERFDPTGTALAVGSFLNVAHDLAGRPFLSYRRASWVALEDKVVVDEFWDRAGIAHQPSIVVPLDGATAASGELDIGDGTVWAADAGSGFHGGASATWWVADDDSREEAIAALDGRTQRVRVMPFLEGVPCSIHGIVLPDGVAVLRPVEMVVLRRERRFVYAGCTTFWDPPDEIRARMRSTCRLAGEQLAREVDYRGTFTVDGVAREDGFWPTELNPRFGGGIMTIARAAELPILLLNDLIVAGHPLGRDAGEVEAELLAAADDRRGGGTWIAGLDHEVADVERTAAYDGASWRWIDDDGAADAHVAAGPGFVRCTYAPEHTPVGSPTGSRAAAFWSLADRDLGTAAGPLTSAGDPF